MAKPSLYAVVILMMVTLSGATSAQTKVEATIELTSLRPAAVRVSLEIEEQVTEWSFRNSYGSVVGLAERIENVTALNTRQSPTHVNKVAPGLYRSVDQVSHIAYQMLLAEPKKIADRSHVSWLTPEHGLLMLSDLLPELTHQKAIRLKLRLPQNWTAVSGLIETSGYYEIPRENQKVVFLVGSALRVLKKKIDDREFRVALSSTWPFQDAEALDRAVRVVREQVRLTGKVFAPNAVIMLLPLDAGPTTWTAETRGNTIVLLLSKSESSRQLLARLSVILAHESLHLWVPNSLELRGDYDWFFEGFTLYQALLSSLKLKLIDFEEYLRTLARVYDSYQLAADRDRWSLLELSERRWTSASSLLYDKGMLVAMIYDLRLREITNGNTNLSGIYPTLIRSSTGRQADANEVIIEVLEQAAMVSDFASNYIRKPIAIDFDAILSRYGLEVKHTGFETTLAARSRLSQSQERVLKSLGYKR